MTPVIPLRDDNPTTRRPLVTIAIMAACVAVFLAWQPTPWATGVEDARFNERYAAIPAEIVERAPLSAQEVADAYGSAQAALAICDIPADGELLATNRCIPGKDVWLSVLTSLFLHGSVLHLLGNLLFLWVFGNNVEDRLNPLGFALFYVAGGVVATMAHVLTDPGSLTPVVGASGAIAAVMGAYLVWWPHARVQTLFFVILVFWFRIPAAAVLASWFVLQFFTSPDEGVAWVAHVAGFVFGVLVGLVLGRPQRRPTAPVWPPATPYRW